MTEQKETATTVNSDGIKNYADLRIVFLQYCENNQLNIEEATDLLDCLKDDLQKQVCHVATRKRFDELGNEIRYYR